jgi:ABC-type amino acid transport system permease subunit
VWRRVVLPQALRTVFPVWTSYLISIFKATSLLSFISLREVFAVARNEAALNFRYLELFAIVMIIYLAMGVPTIVALRALARRWSTERIRTSPLPKNVDVPVGSVT